MVGVVIVAYGDPSAATGLASRVLESGVPRDFIVIVRNPRRGDVFDVETPVRVVHLSKNRGYAAAVNAGIAYLPNRHDDVLVLTHDVDIEAASLKELTLAARQHRDVGVFGPVLRNAATGEVFSVGGHVAADGSVEHDGEIRPGDHLYRCDFVDGSVMLVRRDVLRAVGPLEEKFFLYFEETEFCLRARRAGWGIAVVPGAIATQMPGGSSRPAVYLYLMTRNGLEFRRRAVGLPRALRAALAVALQVLRDVAVLASGRGTDTRRAALPTEIRALTFALTAFAVRRWGPPPPSLTVGSDVSM